MSGVSGGSQGTPDFAGRAPLFPLPNVVHFPHTLLPLHIFEPRYRQMIGDSLASDRLIAMALIKAGDAGPAGPPICPLVCLGRITAEQRLPDGRYFLLLQGLSRARVVDEVPTDRLYRVGRLQLCQDVLREPPAIDRERRRGELLDEYLRLHPGADVPHLLDLSQSPDVPLSILCDVVAAALQLIPSEAQEILEELDVDRRSDLVLRHLRRRQKKSVPPPDRDFPPKFSLN